MRGVRAQHLCRFDAVCSVLWVLKKWGWLRGKVLAQYRHFFLSLFSLFVEGGGARTPSFAPR